MWTVIKWNDVAFNFLEPLNVFFFLLLLLPLLSLSLLSFDCGSCIKYVRTRTCKQLYNGIYTENGQRNTRVTFIMTGQISKHEHITTKCTNERMTRETRKKKKTKMRSNWNESDGRKGKSCSTRKWKMVVDGGQWPLLLVRTNKRLCIDLVGGRSAHKGKPNNILWFHVFLLLRVVLL